MIITQKFPLHSQTENHCTSLAEMMAHRYTDRQISLILNAVSSNDRYSPESSIFIDCGIAATACDTMLIKGAPADIAL